MRWHIAMGAEPPACSTTTSASDAAAGCRQVATHGPGVCFPVMVIPSMSSVMSPASGRSGGGRPATPPTRGRATRVNSSEVLHVNRAETWRFDSPRRNLSAPGLTTWWLYADGTSADHARPCDAR